MSKTKKYTFNARTLSYEVKIRSKRSQILRSACLFVLSLAMAALYAWIYTSVLGLELPKTALLKKSNAQWNSRFEVMNRQLDEYDNTDRKSVV